MLQHDCDVGARTHPCLTPPEGPDDIEQSGWTAYFGKNLEKAVPTDQVKGLCQVDKGDKEWLSLFSAFLLQLSEGEDHVDGGPACTVATLGFRVHSLCQGL